jgi:hypothetical protein
MEGLIEGRESTLDETIPPGQFDEGELDLEEAEEQPVRSSWSASKAVLLLLGTLVAGWWVLHPQPSDREQIEQLVAKAEQGMETDSWVQVMECFSPQYHDKGGLRKGDVTRILQRVMRGTEQIDVTINDYQLEVGRRKAKGYFDVKIVLHEGPRSEVPIRWNLNVDFQKQRLGWYNIWQEGWVVTSVAGHGVDKSFEHML